MAAGHDSLCFLDFASSWEYYVSVEEECYDRKDIDSTRWVRSWRSRS